MINLYDYAAIQREMAIQTRAMMILERRYRKIMTEILNSQYAFAASLLEHGDTHFDGAIIKDQEERINKVKAEYIAAGQYFANRTINKLQAKKSPLEEALYNTVKYASIYSAENIKNIDNKTRRLISSLISTGISEAKTYQEIAKDIIKIGNITNPSRAQTIAQTEIHSISSFSTQEAVRSTGLVSKKKWFDVGDIRTRVPHRNVEQNKAIDINQNYGVEKLDGGIEYLAFPGDPKGSKGNVINCRCNQLFYTR